MREIKVGNVAIGKQHSPFVIAEMSGNHNQSLDSALDIVEAASKSGAHALKLQTYTADTMTLDISSGDFHINEKVYTTSIKKPTLHGSGINQSCSERMSWGWSALVLHSMKQQLIF